MALINYVYWNLRLYFWLNKYFFLYQDDIFTKYTDNLKSTLQSFPTCGRSMLDQSSSQKSLTKHLKTKLLRTRVYKKLQSSFHVEYVIPEITRHSYAQKSVEIRLADIYCEVWQKKFCWITFWLIIT